MQNTLASTWSSSPRRVSSARHAPAGLPQGVFGTMAVLMARPAERFQKRNGVRLQPRHGEDWLQERCVERPRCCLVERLVRAEQFLKAGRQRPNGVIGLLSIEK